MIIVRTYSTACIPDLIAAINQQETIAPFCRQIIDTVDGNLSFDFDASLTLAEENALDALLASWACPVINQSIDTSSLDDTSLPNENVIWSSEKVQQAIDEGTFTFTQRWTNETSTHMSTTLLTYITHSKLSTTPIFLNTGVYVLMWTMEVNVDRSKKGKYSVIMNNGSSDVFLQEYVYSTATADADVYAPLTGFKPLNLTTGYYDFRVDFATVTAESRIRNVRLDLRRMI